MPSTADTIVGADHHPWGSTPYSAAQRRVAVAAIDLFAEHGVDATTLQMIAERIGVTKAAVYHQFKTKEGIVIAAVEVELGRLEEALAEAEDAPGPEARDALLRQVIELSVARRRIVTALQHDPTIIRILATYPPYQVFMTRLFGVLLHGENDAATRLRVAMVASAIGSTVMHPLVADFDDGALREGIFELSREFLRPEG